MSKIDKTNNNETTRKVVDATKVKKIVAGTLITATLMGSTTGVFADSRYKNLNYLGEGYISVAEEVGPQGNGGFISSGVGDAGGISYGLLQLTSKAGGASANKFAFTYLKNEHPEYYKFFEGVGKAGTKSFSDAWTKAYNHNPGEFEKIQLNYKDKEYVKPAVKKVEDAYGIDLLSSRARTEWVHATSVQFGPSGVKEVVGKAGVNDNMDDVELISKLSEEKRDSVGTYKFLGCSQSVRNSVFNRFNREEKEMIKIAKEEAGDSLEDVLNEKVEKDEEIVTSIETDDVVLDIVDDKADTSDEKVEDAEKEDTMEDESIIDDSKDEDDNEDDKNTGGDEPDNDEMEDESIIDEEEVNNNENVDEDDSIVDDEESDADRVDTEENVDKDDSIVDEEVDTDEGIENVEEDNSVVDDSVLGDEETDNNGNTEEDNSTVEEGTQDKTESEDKENSNVEKEESVEDETIEDESIIDDSSIEDTDSNDDKTEDTSNGVENDKTEQSDEDTDNTNTNIEEDKSEEVKEDTNSNNNNVEEVEKEDINTDNSNSENKTDEVEDKSEKVETEKEVEDTKSEDTQDEVKEETQNEETQNDNNEQQDTQADVKTEPTQTEQVVAMSDAEARIQELQAKLEGNLFQSMFSKLSV